MAMRWKFISDESRSVRKSQDDKGMGKMGGGESVRLQHREMVVQAEGCLDAISTAGLDRRPRCHWGRRGRGGQGGRQRPSLEGGDISRTRKCRGEELTGPRSNRA